MILIYLLIDLVFWCFVLNIDGKFCCYKDFLFLVWMYIFFIGKIFELLVICLIIFDVMNNVNFIFMKIRYDFVYLFWFFFFVVDDFRCLYFLLWICVFIFVWWFIFVFVVFLLVRLCFLILSFYNVSKFVFKIVV